MKRKLPFSAVLVLMFISCLITYQITHVSMNLIYSEKLNGYFDNASPYSEKLKEIEEITAEAYVKDIDEDFLVDMISTGFVAGLDDAHSYYIPAEELYGFTDEIVGNMTGIGIRVYRDVDDQSMVIFEVMKNSPAEKAGLLPGDVIYSVDDALYSEIGYEGMYYKIVGEENSSLFLTIKRGNELVSYDITRKHFEAQTVSTKMLESIPDTALVTIYSFDTATSSQFLDAMSELIDGGAKKFIFDLRGNPGGELNSIVTILDYLLPEGPIVRFIDKYGNTEVIESKKSMLNVPMAVIVDSATASAAELFAAALKDYEMATIVGTTTYGKGTMQTTIPLSDGSAVHLSTRFYLPPFSDSYDEIGVIPDIEVTLSEFSASHFYEISEAEDEQLCAAIEALKD